MKPINIGVFLTLLLSFSASVSGEVLQATAKKIWSVSNARQEAFQGAVSRIGTGSFLPFDPDYGRNLQAIAEKRSELSDRLLTLFSNGEYAVAYRCSKLASYYRPSGELFMLEYHTRPPLPDNGCQAPFPDKEFRHDYPSGDLIQVGLSVDKDYNYVFDRRGTLLTHWLGSKCYDASGALCGYRRGLVETAISRPY